MLTWIALTAVSLAQQPPQMNTQVFRPALDAQKTLWTEDSHAGPDGYGTLRAFSQYARAPFRVRDANGDVVPIVSDVAELDLMGSFYFKGLRLGAHLPVYAWTAGPYTTDQPGLGDLQLDLKGTLLDREENELGLALAGRLALPTASVEAPLGAQSTGWEMAAIVDRSFDDLLIVANIGTRGVPRASYANVVWDDQFFIRGGAGYALDDHFGLSGELGAQTNWSSGDNPAGTAVELLGGGWADISEDLVFRGGVSAGLSHSPGAPVARLLAGVSWEPNPYPDRDLDGIVDRDDWCPNVPEDVDGFEDWDGCQDLPVTLVLNLTDEAGLPVERAEIVLDGPERHQLTAADRVSTVHPGTYRLTILAEGFDAVDREVTIGEGEAFTLTEPMVAKVGGLRVWAVDASGAPVEATFTVSGSQPYPADGTAVEVPVGEHALVIRAEGSQAQAVSLHVDRGQQREYSAVMRGEATASKVRLDSDRIQLADRIFFDLNRATLKPESKPLLDEVAALVLSHPELTRVRIEGHTDNHGPSAFNKELSQGRADAVRAYLVSKGVAPARLHSVGYGADKPLDNGGGETADAKNRRVEFHLEG